MRKGAGLVLKGTWGRVYVLFATIREAKGLGDGKAHHLR